MITNLIQALPIFGPVVKDFMAMAFIVLLFVVKQGVMNEGAAGEEKKALAIKDIDEVIEKPGGVDWPSYLNRQAAQDLVLGLLIDLWCWLAKKLGGLMPSSSGSKPVA